MQRKFEARPNNDSIERKAEFGTNGEMLSMMGGRGGRGGGEGARVLNSSMIFELAE